MAVNSKNNHRKGPWVKKSDLVYSGDRKDYKRHFTKSDAHASPFEQFRRWIKKWIKHVEGHKAPPQN